MSELVKFAATELPLADTFTEQVDWVPEQEPSPPHCPKCHPAFAPLAVRVTVVPSPNAAVQVPGQDIPWGVLTTVPLATSGNGEGEIVTDIWLGGGGGGGGGAVALKAAVRDSFPLTVKVQVGEGETLAAPLW
jgi:hypothetical protein